MQTLETKSFPRVYVAIAGVLMQLTLGSVYAWSVFKKPIMELGGWEAPEVGLTFSILIGCLGLAAAFGGKFVDKAGAKKVALVGAVLFALGNALAGLSMYLHNIWLLWLGYGIVAGLGNGLAYITPIAVLIRWFPDKKGLITGMAVMGFGFGAAIVGQLAPLMIGALGLAVTFWVMAAVFLLLMVLSANFLINPPEMKLEKKTDNESSLTIKEAIKKPSFYILWAVLFINVAAGISLVSNLAPLAQSQVKVDAVLAGTIVLATSIFNGIGRLFWSALSDRIGRKNTFLILIVTQIPLFAVLSLITNVWLFTIVCCYILFCYGGGFGVMPSFAADTFGAKNIGSIYGVILTAWSAAAIVGPMVMEYFKKVSNSFSGAFYFAAGLLVIGMLVALVYKKPNLIKK